MPNTTLLIDGDIVAYHAAASVESRTKWPDGSVTVIPGDLKDVQQIIRRTIRDYCVELHTNNAVVCLSCPTVDGWRRKVLPTYKAQRKEELKPHLLADAKQYMRDAYKTYERPTLEADDIMGILSTSGDRFIKGKKIIVSIDKDMKTIPGWLYNPNGGDPVLVSEYDADYWHMHQTLVGDPVDGYKGLPSCGPVGAKGWLTKDDGSPEDRDLLWLSVVSAYENKGLTEEDALVQARVARICRYSDYDFKRKEVKLWTPK